MQALAGVDLDVRSGEFLCLLGPSGCGKSTLLRVLAGLARPDAGRVAIAGEDVTARPAWERDVGLVFQSYALFPHLDVAANVAFGLEMRGLPRAEREGRVAEALALVDLAGLARRRPAELSGGQQQRVAIARAVAIRPRVLLLDEPLSNLDALLRGSVRAELRELHRRTGLTTVMVTHDQAEALSLADRVAVMEQGRILQHDAPEAVYARPATAFVAGFVGSPPANLVRLAPSTPPPWPLPDALAAAVATGPSLLALRPEGLAVVAAGTPGAAPATLVDVEFLGAERRAHLRLPDGQAVIARPWAGWAPGRGGGGGAHRPGAAPCALRRGHRRPPGAARELTTERGRRDMTEARSTWAGRHPAKQALREEVWARLEAAGVAVGPARGNIPNFVGADAAAAALARTEAWRRARVVKCNPDPPQHPLRLRALYEGKTLYCPVPALVREFPYLRLDPTRLVARGVSFELAATSQGYMEHGERLGFEDVPPIDFAVVGSVAVTRAGGRTGKGAGFADLETGIFLALGRLPPATPVATSVHSIQVVEEGRVPMMPHDCPLDLIGTEAGLIEIGAPGPRPPGINWDAVRLDQLDDIPVLRALRDRLPSASG